MKIQAAERTDEDLMCAYQQGEAMAFDALYLRHKGRLYRYFTRQLDGQHAVANELYQDVWMRVIQARLQYQVTAQFTTWLYSIAHNRLLDYWRSYKSHEALDDHADYLSSDAPSPEKHLEQQHTANHIKQALQQLPREQLQVFLLKEESLFSLEEIAMVTGSTRETVKSRLRYAMDKLRSALL